MTIPRDRYAEHYRTLVQPRIVRAIDFSAFFVALGLEGFADQIARITRRAWRLGGSHLDPKLWEELEAWIETRFLEHVAAATERVEVECALAERVATDIRIWERAIAQAFPA